MQFTLLMLVLLVPLAFPYNFFGTSDLTSNVFKLQPWIFFFLWADHIAEITKALLITYAVD